jgi:hypothetical protein
MEPVCWIQVFLLFSGEFWQIAVFVFKEAYDEFKHVLLAFIYDKYDLTSPVANEVGFARCYVNFLDFMFFS